MCACLTLMCECYVNAMSAEVCTLSLSTHAYKNRLVCMIHDAGTPECNAELAVLDASNILAGPVARIRLPHHIPYVRGVSGEWIGSSRLVDRMICDLHFPDVPTFSALCARLQVSWTKEFLVPGSALDRVRAKKQLQQS